MADVRLVGSADEVVPVIVGELGAHPSAAKAATRPCS